MIRVGIPRSLLYYQYYPMWRAFFHRLGAEVVVSPPTTQAMLNAGSARVVADTCLPVKVYCGHVLSLRDKCDFMFIPAVRSIKPRIYNCSKFLALPDLTRAVIPECPPILDIDFDVNIGKRRLYQAIYKLGREFTWNPAVIRYAAQAAWEEHRKYRDIMSSFSLTMPEAISRLEAGPERRVGMMEPDRPSVALVGHPYMLYDEHVNHRLVHRLRQAGYRVLAPEMLTPAQTDAAIEKTVGSGYWTYEEEVCGAGGHYLESGVAGVIGLMAFGCGPDSLMMNMVRRYADKQRKVPFMCLTLEEHTAETGIVTRLEAFLDMIAQRQRKKAAVCV